MHKPKLIIEPAYFDQYNQPCYELTQTKGLREEQNNELLESALADGYISAVAETLKAWICDQVRLNARDRKVDVLEIGGGTGDLFDKIKEDVSSYINLEPSRIVLLGNDLQRIAEPSYSCIRSSAELIPLPDESVDVVVSIASLDHVPDYRKGLLEVSRVLRENGRFLLTVNNRRSWWKLVLARTRYLRARETEIAKDHYFQWSFLECERKLSEYMDVCSMTTTTFWPYAPYVWKWLLPFTDALVRPLIPGYGSNILAVCRKRLS